MRLALFAVLLAGCGYTSQYTPPADGRPRAVWREDKVIVAAAGASIDVRCAAAVREITGSRRQGPPAPSSGYYTPRWYGSPMLVIHHGLAPRLLRPPIFFSPSLALASAAHTGHGGRVAVDAGRGVAKVGGGVGGGGRGGGGSGLEQVAVYLAVVALLTLPIIDTALALAPAEKAEDSARAIDEANALNDLLRWDGSPCALAEEGGSLAP